MQYYWLNKESNKKLIVFFAGWSFDYFPFISLNCKDNDVVVIYDYTNLDNIPDFGNYEFKTLISWSMGVFTAYYLKDKLPKFDRKIAVNGTAYPVDDNYGIPKKTFDLTLKFVHSGLQGKFYKNVFNDDNLYEKYLQNPVQRSIENRANELSSLYELFSSVNVKYDGVFYDFAVIGKYDRIIPAKNQINFWGDKSKIIDCGHFPFYNYFDWEDLCKLTQNP